MNARKTAFGLITATLGTLSLLLTLTAGAASAGTLVHPSRAMSALPLGGLLAYRTHTQVLSRNGTGSAVVACPAGTLPVGGGTTVQNPLIEHVEQGGFRASGAAGRLDAYQASVQVSGLRHGAKARFAVQVVCVPAAAVFVVYAIHTQVLAANGVSWWGVGCPAGTLPVGGGTVVKTTVIERVVQAGFHASAVTGKFDGYQASVRVSGLPRGRKVPFTVQASCIPAGLTVVVYAIHALALGANGSTWWGVPCPAGAVPVGGGTAVANPLVENVAQAGFHTSAVAGRLDGYQASVHVGGLPHGREVPFAVQAACVPAATPPVYGPPSKVVSVSGSRP